MGLTKPRAAQIFNLDYKQSTRVVTTTNITLTGGAPNSVDGVNLSLNDRILVTGQTTGSQNGLYLVTTLGSGANGTWARTSDGNENGEIEAGMIVMVTEGTIYADTQWKLITDDPITIGTTALTFTQNYMANSISGGTSNVVVNSNANVTISSAGTANVLTVSSAGTVTSGTASVTGNVTGGNILTGGLISATGNITGGNIRTAGVVSATGDMFGKELWSTQSSGDEGGQVNLGIPAANTALTGQVTIDVFQNQLRFFQGNSSRGAYIDLSAAAVGVGSNLLAGGGGGGTPGGSNTQVQFNDGGAFGGNAQFTYNKATNILTAGIISSSNNGNGTNFQVGDDAYIGDINTADTIGIRGQQNAANGFIVFGNADSTGKLGRAGTGPLTYVGAFSATGNIDGGNLRTAGLISATGAITGAALTGTSLTVSTGNITGGNLLLSGAILDSAQLDIQTSAANANIVLTPNGTGNVNTGANLSVTGNVQAGNLKTAGLISATSTITSAANITGGNILTAGLISATSTITSAANITGGNILTAGIMSSTGNGIHGNILTAGLISATSTITSAANVIGGNISTAGLITATGNIQGGNLRTAGLITATGAITGAAITGSSLTVTTGNITAGNLIISGAIQDSAQLDIQTTAANANIVLTPNGTGVIVAAKDIRNGQATGVGNIGAAGATFNTVFAKATSAQYADLAENYLADSNYEPGTVVEFGGMNEVTISTQNHSTRVAGIVSTNPSYLMNSAQAGEHVIAVALTGRVPCSVVGTIAKGDRLVASDQPGVAQPLDKNFYEPGCIIGKALESYNSNQIGTIEVAVGRF